MEVDFVSKLTAQSTLVEVPSHGVSLELSRKGELLGETFEQDPQLPGVVVTESGLVRGAISRGQYLRQIGRHLGREIYHPRPIQLIFEAAESMEEPLILTAATPIQEAVRAALNRPTAVVYEPVILKGVDLERQEQIRLIDFQDLLRADSKISQLRNQQMKQILNTVREGFLLVDANYRIAAEYSTSLETIFGTQNIAGRLFHEVLAEFLSGERSQLGREYLDTLFNPEVIEKLVVKINPLLKVESSHNGHRKHLAFAFQRSLEDGAIRRILIKVADVTREVEMANELEQQEQKARQRLDLVFDIMRADAGAVQTFIAKFEEQMLQGEKLLVANGHAPASQRIEALFRSIHGLKGEASLLGLKLYQADLHEFEESLVRRREDADLQVEHLMALQPELTQLKNLAAETRSVMEQFRRLGQTAEEHARTATSAPPNDDVRSSQQVRAPGEASAAQAVTSAPGTAGSRAWQVASATAATSATTSTSSTTATAVAPPGLFESMRRWVEEMAKEMGKSARFYSRATEAEIPARYRELVRNALIQMTRNALAHGIEPPEVRKQQGKPAMGTLQFAVKRHPEREQLELVFQDDGRGLDLEKLQRRAQELGISVSRPEQLPSLIFQPGFTTAEQTSGHAGRGVGMDLVKEQIEKLGGFIVPHSRSGAFCAFQMVLPFEDP